MRANMKYVITNDEIFKFRKTDISQSNAFIQFIVETPIIRKEMKGVSLFCKLINY